MSEHAVVRTVGLILAQQEYLRALLYRRLVAVPPASAALFLEPHPDDVAIGCGGVVLKYVAAHTPVEIVCLTDGRACVAPRAARVAIAARRAEESRAVARALGIAPPALIGCPEDELVRPERTAELVGRLRQILKASPADAVFIPFELEVHPLHRYACHLLALAMQDARRARTVYAYAVASCPPPSVVVDITAQAEAKQRLVGLYESQLHLRDYRRDLELLNGYCAPIAGPGARACEVFYDRAEQRFVEEILAMQLDAPAALECGIQPMVPET
ncbi:MAG: PIG-L family deacetylase [Planctomycetota bacterium]